MRIDRSIDAANMVLVSPQRQYYTIYHFVSMAGWLARILALFTYISVISDCQKRQARIVVVLHMSGIVCITSF